MRGCALGLIVVAGCIGTSESDEGSYTHVHITSETRFDRIDVYWLNGDAGSREPPLTPELLRSGQPRPAPSFVGIGRIPFVEVHTLDPARASFDAETWELTSDFDLTAAVGYLGDTVVGAAAVEPRYVYRDSAWHADVELPLVADVERFGAAYDCIRVWYTAMTGPVLPTYYAVHADDFDCDGLGGADCQPTVTCTPDVPSSCGCAPAP